MSEELSSIIIHWLEPKPKLQNAQASPQCRDRIRLPNRECVIHLLHVLRLEKKGAHSSVEVTLKLDSIYNKTFI